MPRVRGIFLSIAVSSFSGVLAYGSDLTFDRDIRPILEQHCASCHSSQLHQSGLALETEASLSRGGSLDGPAVIAGKSETSPLVLRLRGQKAPRMPLNGEPVPAEKIA